MQRALVVRAAIWVAGTIPVLSQQERSIVELLRVQGALSAERAKEVLAAAEIADNKYLDLQATGAAEVECGRYFIKARFLRGIAVAFGETSGREDSVDALYEMRSCMESPGEFLSYVDSQIAVLVASSKEL